MDKHHFLNTTKPERNITEVRINCGHTFRHNFLHDVPGWMISALEPSVRTGKGSLGISDSEPWPFQVNRQLPLRSSFGAFTLWPRSESHTGSGRCWDANSAGHAWAEMQSLFEAIRPQLPEPQVVTPESPTGFWLGILLTPHGLEQPPQVVHFAIGLSCCLCAAMVTRAI
jgi:hypothetical protein